jgi:hypothetical protein
MAITRKPRAEEQREAQIQALIGKGGSVARRVKAAAEESANATVPVILRIPGDTLSRVDEAVSTRKVKTPRHTWLLEAVVEKLDRESA